MEKNIALLAKLFYVNTCLLLYLKRFNVMKMLSVKQLIASVIAVSCISAVTADPVYCPQRITCTIGTKNNVSDCTAFGNGWSISGVTYNSLNYFKPGNYIFNFSAGQASPQSAVNCSFVYHSLDTGTYISVIMSNNNLTVMKNAPKKFSKWTNSSLYSWYCFSPNGAYSKINNASSCPFQQK